MPLPLNRMLCVLKKVPGVTLSDYQSAHTSSGNVRFLLNGLTSGHHRQLLHRLAVLLHLAARGAGGPTKYVAWCAYIAIDPAAVGRRQLC